MTAASVVIPAHDEEARIARCLRTLLADVGPDVFEVVVVANGCRDGTAEVARDVPGVTVVELDEASKIAALRAGDATATRYPRIYLDADVELTGQAALAIARALDTSAPRVAGVRGELVLSRSTRPVRWYHQFRRELPVLREGVIGAGVYAMNASGRARLGPWPDVLGDDQFVFRSFAPDERVTVPEHRSLVAASPDLAAEVRRGIRVARGNAELTAGAAGTPLPPPPAGILTALCACLFRPRTWPSAATWVVVSAWIRILSRRPSPAGDWSRTGRHLVGEGRP